MTSPSVPPTRVTVTSTAAPSSLTLYVAASNLVPEFQAKHDWRLPISFFGGVGLYFAARTLLPH